MKQKIFLLFIFLWCIQQVKADEGMWLPHLLQKLNYTDMQKLGVKLTPEQIYSVNNSSLKDAIVNFGNFCTGEIISKDGLILTNHHCGYEAIQSHSSVEKNYLANGFWSADKREELPNQDLTVSFLIRIEDVTTQILSGITPDLKPSEVDARIDQLKKQIEQKAQEGNHYNAQVKDFYQGNEYYLFVYETFSDVRLVGAPPSSIGKFGGETDNWMWPRHTGDFSLFRVYSGPDGKPAPYHPDNIPLKPRHYLPISLKGVKKDDFSMVLGYPGNTERYLSSEGVKLTYDQSNPLKIKIRGKKLSIMKEDMDADPQIKIKYAAKYAQIINYYKYFIGQNEGLKRLKVVDKKTRQEEVFQQWTTKTEEASKNYGTVLTDISKIHEDLRKVNPLMIYLEEAILGTDILLLAYQYNELYALLQSKATGPELDAAKANIRNIQENHFKNYNNSTDEKILAAMLQLYYHDIHPNFHPSVFKTIEKKYKKNFSAYSKAVFEKSIFASPQKLNSFLIAPDAKKLEKDPAFNTMNSVLEMFIGQIRPYIVNVYDRLDKANTIFTKGILEMSANEKLYPDANFSMRLTYGTVQDYFPRDAVYYNYYTTLEGIIQKEDSSSEEFVVPPKLKELYRQKDYGKYANSDGHLPVCFITNNDITGGNSGSPVINAQGHLIGTAFDGNWEAMSGDIVYEPSLQRCIVTDIRYILFIIDKYAGAKNIIEELTVAD